jgi:hypothetical protein
MSRTMPFPPGPPTRPTAAPGATPMPTRTAPRRRLRWPLVLLFVLLLCCSSSLICGLGFGVFHSFVGGMFSGGSAPAGSQVPSVNSTPVTAGLVVADFMDAMQKADYARAYGDLDPALTLDLLPDAFAQQAARSDQCFGRITSATRASERVLSPTEQQFTYTIGRAKLAHTFPLHITLSQGVDGAWGVSSYGDALVPPGNPLCQA